MKRELVCLCFGPEMLWRKSSTLTVIGSRRLDPEVVLVHVVGPQYNGEEFLVDNVLPDGSVDMPGFLKQLLAVPAGVQVVQPVLDIIVVAMEESMHGGQPDLLVYSRVAYREVHTHITHM